MIVPKFWAESRIQQGIGRNQVTVRRYGWSDESQLNAQVNADARAREALGRILSGEKLRRRERKVPYNGADGLPIREEILSTHGEAVITRNSYGAHCLNTPNVLIADVDIRESHGWGGISYLIAAAITFLAYSGSGCCEKRSIGMVMLVGVFAGTAFACDKLSEAFSKLHRNRTGGPVSAARERVRAFAAAHPQWSLRVYRTPAGFRVLASQATFAANRPEVTECFSALGVDPVYARMCLNQQCFRARLTAKPWRMGSASKDRPPYGVWPVKPELLPARAEWAAEYERAAAGFAACHFVETIGSGVVHPDVRGVIELHDAQCRATTQLPLA